MIRAWHWFCWKVCNDWWPFGFGPIAKPIYFWFLPGSGEHVLEQKMGTGLASTKK